VDRILLIATGLFIATTAFAADTLCTTQEIIIFSCSTGTNIVSVCASHELSTSKGYMQYRFGRIGKVEQSIPKVKKGIPPDLKLTASKDDMGDYNDFSFTQGRYRYSITSNRQLKVYHNRFLALSSYDGITIEDTNKSIRDGSIIYNANCQPDTKPFNANELSKLIGVPVVRAEH
jgi:hypothetical protein